LENGISLSSETEPDHKDEEVLIESARSDPDAFAVLYRRYLTPVYRYLLSKLNTVHDAENVTAQVFVEALEGLVNFRYRKAGSFAAWLFTIARRRVIDFYRRHPSTQLTDLPSVEPGLQTIAEKSEDMQRLARLLQQFDEEQRELLRLRFSANLSFAEIGLIEGRSEAAVKMAVYRLVDTLKSQWEAENE
jgi:RNA polymerase sigma-70 factor, ECF subfamily